MRTRQSKLGRITMGLAIAIGAVAFAGAAEAGKGHDGWHKHHGHGWQDGPYVYYGGYPGYGYQPPPGYVVLPPPQPIYVQPAPIYLQPQPVYERPSLNFVFPIRID